MNKLKEKITDGNPVVGSWLSIGHPAVAEIMAILEFDFVLIDLEHTSISLDTTQELVHAIEATDTSTVPIVRVPDNDPVWIQRTLDTGVKNIMVPKVDTQTEASSLVDSVRYPPDGNRGIAGSRATGYGINFEEHVSSVNGDILTIAQIETKEAIDNVTAIADTDGIGATFIGPADLSGALDRFGNRESMEFVETVDAVIDTTQQLDIPIGTFSVEPNAIQRSVERGFDFVIAGKDASHLANGCERVKEVFHDTIERRTVDDPATD